MYINNDVNHNKTGTSKVGAISKAQKAQKTFFWKKLEIFEFFSFRKCRIVPKNVKKGDPLGFINIHSVAKYQKTRRGDSFETLKNFRKKVAQCRKKNRKGDPLVSSGFVGYVKLLKNERGTFPLTGLGLMVVVLVVSMIVRKVDQSEWDCSLTKKKRKQDGNVPSRRHILGSKIFKEQLLEKFGKKNFFQKKKLIFFRKKVFFRSHNAEKLIKKFMV